MDPPATQMILILAGGFFFFLGACWGSFSNVLAYRLPLGLPFGASVSRCPNCQRKILPFDNIPVVSWLILRGKCRFCRWPIPARYVIVEALFGLMFLLLYLIELSRWTGVILPDAFLADRHVHDPVSLYWQGLGLYLYHAVLLTFLGMGAALQSRSAIMPRRMLLLALAFGLIPAAVWPTLHVTVENPSPFGTWIGVGDAWLGAWLGAFFDVVHSMAFPVATGSPTPKQAASAPQQSRVSRMFQPGFTLSGAFLGLTGISVLFCIAVGIRLAAWLLRNPRAIQRIPTLITIIAALATLAFVWAPIDDQQMLNSLLAVATASVLALLLLGIRWKRSLPVQE